MSRRLSTLLISLAVGVVFAFGLFLHGKAGGGLLLITDAVLITLAMSSWGNANPRGRPVRIAVIAVIAAIAIVKLVE